jgi:hypothetical protein
MKGFLFLFLLSYCTAAFPQEKTAIDRLAEFAENINTFNHLYPQEKVYLHFDNTAYYLGETIWFKAYVVAATSLARSDSSKVLYVELLTPEGRIKETKKLKIENGQAHSCFNLRNLYFPGFYEIRAYTRCMLNFGQETIFSRVFPVYNERPEMTNPAHVKPARVWGKIKQFNLETISFTSLRKKEKTKNLQLAFFPEGGNLVANLTSRVAFKAVNKEGRAVDVSGRIYNSRGKEVASFSTLHLGMGSFILSPDGNKYVAKVNYDKKEYRFHLPKSLPSGYAVRVENLHPDTVSVQVEKTAGISTQMLGITFASRGQVYAFEAFEINSSGQHTISLPKEKLPAGVVQITLFTPASEVLAQRQVFIDRDMQVLPVRITHTPASLAPFSPVAMDFEVKDKDNLPIETDFSLSVREKEAQTGTNTDNIQYNLLLSSDLKGYIENPAYYFETDDREHRTNLDLLMSVQGWVRYPWKQAAGVEPFEVRHEVEKKLTIGGRVFSPNRKNPEKDSEVVIWVTSTPEGEALTGRCITNNEGKYKFNSPDITGTYKLWLGAKKKNKKGEYQSGKLHITIDRYFSPEPSAFDYYETCLQGGGSIEKPFSASNKPMEEEVQIKDDVSPQSQLDDNPEKSDSLPDSQWEIALPEVEVNALDRGAMQNGTIAFYDIAHELDRYKDMGKSEPNNILEFLAEVDPNFSWNREGLTTPWTGEYGIRTVYCGHYAPVFVDNALCASIRRSKFLEDLNIDRVASIAIYSNGIRFPITILTSDYT